jgi:putative phosphonate metabolism protein
MSGPRYAIYFVPAAESQLYQFGSSVIGYDCYERSETELAPDFPLTEAGWLQLVAAPRRYGFHATIKAPFYLAEGVSSTDLEQALDRFAASAVKAPAIEPKVDLINEFIAIVPREPSYALSQLAAQCVVAFDRFRAPLTEGERERRLAAGLDERQSANLEKWGYPYVFEDFRFHMTLTGPLRAADRRAVFAYLLKMFDAASIERPIMVDRLVLVRESWPNTPFVVVHQVLLGEG